MAIYNNAIAEYDELSMCLTNVRQQARAIERRDELEEQVGLLRRIWRALPLCQASL